MREDKYQTMIATLPDYIILDCSKDTRVLMSLFGNKTEFILDKLILAIADRVLFPYRLQRQMSTLQKYLYTTIESTDYPIRLNRNNVSILNHLITAEQTGFNLMDKIQSHKLYIDNRYLPYCFETILSTSDVLLKKLDECDYFNDLFELTE